MTKNKLYGHNELYSHLLSLYERKQLPQSFIISGPATIGKRTLLQALLQKILPTTQLQTLYSWTDETDGIIKISTIRDLQKKLQLTNTSDHFIILIKEIDRLTLPAANALLKVLEEPPKGVYFFLTTSKPQNLLPTIVSRCQIYQAAPLSDEITNQFRQENDLNEFSDSIYNGFPGLIVRSNNSEDFKTRIDLAKDLINVINQSSPANTDYWEIKKNISNLERSQIQELCEVTLRLLQTHKQNISPNWHKITKQVHKAQILAAGNIHRQIVTDKLLT